MKFSVLTVILFLFLCSTNMEAQQKVSIFQGTVYIKQNKAEVVNDSVCWDMDMYVSGIQVGRNQSMLFIPVLFNGKDSLQLTPVLLNGSGKNLLYSRKMSENEKSIQLLSASAILKNEPSKLIVISVTNQFLYQPWMEKASLKLIGELEKLDGTPIYTRVDILSEDLKLK